MPRSSQRTRADHRSGDSGPLPDPASLERPWLASYPPGVPPTYELPDVPVSRFLDDAARDFPNNVATYFHGAKLSYAEVAEQTTRFATALEGLGVSAGSRVGLVLPNLPANVIATFATFRLGAVVVQNDPRLSDDDLLHQLRDADCDVVVCLRATLPRLVGLVNELADRPQLVVTGVEEWLPRRKRVLMPLLGRRSGSYLARSKNDDAHEWSDLVEDAAPHGRRAAATSDELAMLQYTGGTTGVRKAVMLTHGNLVANSFQARLWVPDVQAGKERMLAAMPFAHAYGFTLGMLAAVLSAASLVLVEEPDAEEILQVIDRTRPTLFPGVPALYRALADHPDAESYDLSSIRACVSGAAALDPEVARRFEELTGGARLREGYGLSEAAPLTHANPIYGRYKPGTIGLPVTGTIACVVDPDDHSQVLPVGETGELIVHGPQVMRGYWNDPDESERVLRDGWLLTGDLAEVDAEGYFRLIDRKADVIRYRGHRLYPHDLEDVLHRHPGVRSATVVGIPDEDAGEIAVAFVVPREQATFNAEELAAHCRQYLAEYKVPRRFEIRSQLPTTMIGKVLRRHLREEALREDSVHPDVVGEDAS